MKIQRDLDKEKESVGHAKVRPLRKDYERKSYVLHSYHSYLRGKNLVLYSKAPKVQWTTWPWTVFGAAVKWP